MFAHIVEPLKKSVWCQVYQHHLTCGFYSAETLAAMRERKYQAKKVKAEKIVEEEKARQEKIV